MMHHEEHRDLDLIERRVAEAERRAFDSLLRTMAVARKVRVKALGTKR